MLTFPLIPLYAETHFKFFRLFPSLLFKRSPEAVFDIPRRVSPGNDLPVVLLLNDVHLFPFECMEVKIAVSQKNCPPQVFQFIDLKKNIVEHPFSFQSRVYLFTIPRNRLQNGLCHINCSVVIKKGNRTQTIINDNLTTSSKLPFSCFIADEYLPCHEFCSYGDMHAHSHFSQSHVEFGPPVQIIDLFTKCYGADFTGVTDHSYDLSCSMENYLLADHSIGRWKVLKKEILREDPKCIMLLGEEISCLNSRNKVVHLCGFGSNEFIPGSLDGARRHAFREPQLSIEKVAVILHANQGVAFAAHPGSKMGFMQRIFLKRGNWTSEDLSFGINGLQAVNSGFDISWHRAKALWVKELLKGKKMSLIAGNDSHGDFNRYRYLSIPFIFIKELFDRHFCAAMTGAYEKIKSKNQLIEILKNGNTFVTNGPMLCLSAGDAIYDSIIGNHGRDFKGDGITIILTSSYEFGEIAAIRVFWGNYASGKESVFFSKKCNKAGFSLHERISISAIKGQKGYLRAEAECRKQDGTISYSATSPFYL